MEGECRLLLLLLLLARGRGGRSQEMVLAFHLGLEGSLEELEERGVRVELLSAGTDGLDGPTDAAGGALASWPGVNICAGAVWTQATPGRASNARRRLEDNDRSVSIDKYCR